DPLRRQRPCRAEHHPLEQVARTLAKELRAPVGAGCIGDAVGIGQRSLRKSAEFLPWQGQRRLNSSLRRTAAFGGLAFSQGRIGRWRGGIASIKSWHDRPAR